MTRRHKGVFVLQPGFDVPVLVLPYIKPGDAGWTRRTHRSAVAAFATDQQYRVRPYGPLVIGRKARTRGETPWIKLAQNPKVLDGTR